MKKNALFATLAAATILGGCAQGGIDPFAGSSSPQAPPPTEELQYFVRYPDGTLAPVQLPPSVVAGFGAPGGPANGVVYAPPLVAGGPTNQPRFYGAQPSGAPQQVGAVQTTVMASPQAAPVYAPAAPAPSFQAPAATAAFPAPSAPQPVVTRTAAAPAPLQPAPYQPTPEAPAFPTSGGFAQAVAAPGIATMDPELAAALRRQGIDPGEVVGLEYGGASFSGPAAPLVAPPSVVASRPAAPAAAFPVAPGPMAAALPTPAPAPRAVGMAPVASPRDAALPTPRPPQSQSAAAPAPAPRPAPASAASAASAGGAPQMDPALIEALRRQGIDPSEVVGLQIDGGAASLGGGAAASAPAPRAEAGGGALTRAGASGAPESAPTPRMSPVRSRGDRQAAAAPAPAPQPSRVAAAPAPQPQSRPAAAAASSGAPARIGGSSWRLTLLRGQPIGPGVELHFDGAQNFAGGSGPCSSYSFEFQEGAGGALQVDGVGADPRACDRSAEEERYFTALNLVNGYRVSAEGRLDLLGAGGALLASFEPL